MKKLIFVLLMVFLVTPIMLAQVYQKITGYNSYVNALAFSPGGKYIASGEKDGTIKIMDADNGELIKVIKTKNSIFKLAFSNEAKEICAGIAPLLSISAEIDPFIVVYDMYNGLLKQNIDVKSRSPNFFYSNPDKKLMTIVPELTMDNCTYTYDYSLSTYLNSNCYKLEFNNYSLSDNNYSVNYIDRIHFWSFNSPWTVSASGKYIAICPENEKSDKISTNPVKNF
ncbi:MAG: WD40 repeat domain-containing protein, partial [Ignavibacteria bacterium]